MKPSVAACVACVACVWRAAALALVLALPATAAPSPDTPAAAPQVDALLLFDRVATRAAVIRNRAEFDAYMRICTAPDNPFNGLSGEAKRRFAASLDFDKLRAGGSPELADIEAELTLSEAWRLLSLFGLQSRVRWMPDIRVVSDDDRLVDAFRTLYRSIVK